MANDPNPSVPPKKDDKPSTEPEKNWAEILYTPERVMKWMKGEITLAELSAVSGPEMLEMAVIGFSMYEQGRYDDARVIFDALCALDPREPYYRTALGAVYLAQENLEQAEQLFNEAIRLNDREIASYVNRGEVYLRQGKILEAAQDFKKAVDLDPENKDPLTRRARLLAAAALQTLEAAQQNQNAPAKASDKAAAPAAKAPAAGKAAPAAAAAKAPAAAKPAAKAPAAKGGAAKKK